MCDGEAATADPTVDQRNGICLVPHAKSAWHPALWAAADAVVVPDAFFDFVGGSIMLPVWFAAFGSESVDAIGRLGCPRLRSAS